MKLSLPLTALALLAVHPATAARHPDPIPDCGTWWFQCTRAASNCCYFAAEQANTTCPMSRAKHYFLLGRCKKLFDGGAEPYHRTDCVSATLAGLAMTMGDRSLDFPVNCTIDDIKDMP